LSVLSAVEGLSADGRLALFLLPPGEGGAKRRMRVGEFIEIHISPDKDTI
jgi:hypothetical protein